MKSDGFSYIQSSTNNGFDSENSSVVNHYDSFASSKTSTSRDVIQIPKEHGRPSESRAESNSPSAVGRTKQSMNSDVSTSQDLPQGQKKRGRPRGSRNQTSNPKRQKTGQDTSASSPAQPKTTRRSTRLLTNQLESPSSSITAEKRIKLNRKVNTTADKQIKLNRKVNRAVVHSDESDTTVRGPAEQSPQATRVTSQPTAESSHQHPSTKTTRGRSHPNPELTYLDLLDIHKAIATAKTPTWMTRPPNQIGMKSGGTPKASEWFTLYTVYMVLSIIPRIYHSEDIKRSTLCQSLIYAVEIVNCALSRNFSKHDSENLQHLLKTYRDHLATHWEGVSIKPNLHLAQHIPKIAKLFGPPSYTAAWVGERVNGILVKIPKNYHIGAIFLLET